MGWYILLSTNILILSFHHFEVVEWHLPMNLWMKYIKWCKILLLTFKHSMTRFLYCDDIFRPKREKFIPEFSKLYEVYLLFMSRKLR
jgi:hypothetical protein